MEQNSENISDTSNGKPGEAPGIKVYPKLACRLGFCH